MFGKPKTNGPIGPKQLTEHAGYARAFAKYQELQLDLATAEHELAEARAGLAGCSVPQNVTRAAAALLEGQEAPAQIDIEALVAQAERHEKRIPVLREAIRLQCGILDRFKNEASMEILKEVRPHYAAIVRRMAEAGAELKKICDEEHALRTACLEADLYFASHCGLAMPLKGFRTFSHGNETDVWERWLEEARVAYPEFKL